MEDRNHAIRDLADALRRLSRADQTGEQQTVRISINPAGPVKGEDAELYRSIDVTPKAAQVLADAVDSMNAYLSSEQPEVLASEWGADAVAQNYPDLYAKVTDVFLLIDPDAYLDDVLNSPDPDASMVAFEQMVTGEWDGEL